MEKKGTKIRKRAFPGLFWGTCKGLGEYYEFDPLPLRLIVIMLWIIAPLPTLLIYWVVTFMFMQQPSQEDMIKFFEDKDK